VSVALLIASDEAQTALPDESNDCMWEGYLIFLIFSAIVNIIVIPCFFWALLRNRNYVEVRRIFTFVVFKYRISIIIIIMSNFQCEKLTAEDIKLFEDGKLDSKTAHLTENEGLLVPYDSSFEISKSSLVVCENTK